MTLIVPQSVEFDHTLTTASTDALSIRIDSGQTAGPWTPADLDSRAAYALAPTANQVLTVQASFSIDPLLPPPSPSVMIRARPLLGTTSVLGSVAATSVVLPAGSSTIVTAPQAFPLVGVDIWNHGIGKYSVVWMWQVQFVGGGPWLDIGATHHTIYVTLDAPSPPWSQAADLPHRAIWPWATVLDFACAWASGITITGTLADAAASTAKAIESALFDLGKRALVPLVYGEPNYLSADATQFALTTFLKTVAGIPPSGKTAEVDCGDMSAALQVFANALGCGLGRHRIQQKQSIGGVGFDTNPLRLIGKPSARADFYSWHDVTVRRDPNPDDDRVFDSCLMVDYDSNPASATKSKFHLAGGVDRGALSGVSGFNWVRRLVKQSDWPNCEGVEFNTPCIEQCVDAQSPAQPVAFVYNYYRNEIERLAPPLAPSVEIDVVGHPPAIPGFDVYAAVVNPVRLSMPGDLVRQSVEYFYLGRDVEDRRVALALISARTSADARDALAWVLTSSNHVATVLLDDEAMGDVSFENSAKNAGYFVASTIVARMHSIGQTFVAPRPLLQRVALAFPRLPAQLGDSRSQQ